MTHENRPRHQHEAWEIVQNEEGGSYCAACGEPIAVKTRRFHVGAILTVTTGTILSSLQEIQNLLEWTVDGPVHGHQISRVVKETAPFLRETFPDLAEVTGLPPRGGDWDEESVSEWLSTFGDQYRDVPRMPTPPAHVDPLSELNPDRTIVIARTSKEGNTSATDPLRP